jgi:hypothetical protein
MTKTPQYLNAETRYSTSLRVGDRVTVHDNSYVLMVTPVGCKPALPAGTMSSTTRWPKLRLIATNCVLPAASSDLNITNNAIIVCEDTGTTFFVRISQLRLY